MSQRGYEAARQIAERLRPYSTVLLKLFVDQERRRRLELVGSGTYVSIGNTYGILTAHHSAATLTGQYALGLSVGREHEEHNFTVRPDSITITPIAVPITDEFGPDLAFITLADWDKISRIKASKSFLPLLRDREKMLNDPPPIENSLWYVCGAPYEKLRRDTSEAGFPDGTLEFMDLCLVGGVDRIIDRGDYDYVETDIVDPSGDIPTNFEGMSGGALWQVPVAPAEGVPFAPIDHYLTGVIFYQGVSESGTRFLRCHGRKSIYQHVINAIT